MAGLHRHRRRWFNPLRLVLEALLIVAMALALLMLALPLIAPVVTDGARVLLLAALLALAVWLLASGRVRALNPAQRLSREVERLALVAQHTSNSVIITGAGNRINWVNQGFTRISGYTLDEAMGRTPGELLGSSHADPAQLQELARATAAGEPCRVELVNRAKDGHEYWVDINLQPIRDEQGALVGFMEVDSDTSARKQAEREIELREQRLRQVIDLVPSLIYIKGPDARYLLVNQHYADFLDRPISELIGKSALELGWSAQVAERAEAAEAQVRVSGQSDMAEELEPSGPDGRSHLYLTARVPFNFSQAHPNAVLGVSTDLTDLTSARDDVRRSLLLLKATMEAVVDGVLVTDAAGTILEFNQRLLQMWRITPEVAPTRDSRQAIRSVLGQLCDPAQFVAGFRDMLGQPKAESFDTLALKDGRIIERHSRPRIVDGLAMGRVWSYRDVTVRERALADLRTSEVRLRQVIDLVPHTIFAKDRQGRLLMANQALADFYQRPVPELIGKTSAEIDGDAQLGARFDMQDALVRSSGRAQRFAEHLVRSPDGKEHVFAANRMPFRYSEEHPDAVLGVATDLTELVAAQGAMRKSLALLEATLESTADGILVVTQDLRIAAHNQRFLDLWRLPLELVLASQQLRLRDMARDQLLDPEPFFALADKTITELLLETFDLVAFKDGRAMERYSRPLLMEGAAVGRVWSFRDVTARAQAEAELREREAQLLLVAESMPAIVVHYDKDLICRYANTRYAQALGQDPGAVIGRPMAELLGPRLMALGQDLMHRALSGETVRYERAHHQDASRTLDVTLVPYLRPDGVQDGYFGFAFDITELKQAENQLRASERHLRAIIDHEPAAVTLANLEDRFLDVNAAGLAMLEAGSLAEAQVCPIIEFVAPEHREAFVALGRRAMFEPDASLEFELIGLRGTRRWLETVAAPIRNEAGRITSMLGLTRDISAQKKIEATRASLESQLRESQKMQALGTLAGGIAHDFNNIIAAILGNVALARQDIDSGRASRAQESVSEIARAGERAKNLVQQILTFSRRQPVELRPTQLSQVVEESARLLRASLPARLGLSVRCDPQAPMVLADALQFQQVLLNLAGNAMQAMPDGPGRIEIELDAVTLDAALAGASPELDALRQRYPGALARLRVSDDGPGMEQDVRERAFEPFFTTKPMGEGTGLGLSVVRGIVLAHEGVITLDSQPGQGATFSIYLPGAPAQAGAPLADAPRPRPQIAAAAPASGARATRVLYIDDDEAMVFMVKRLLERAGLRVSAHQDQYRALDELRAEAGAFDLVVSDYNMPGLSGLDVARQVRGIRADLPVALVSGFIDEALQAQARDAGVRELIFKATDAHEFCAVIGRLADASRGPD